MMRRGRLALVLLLWLFPPSAMASEGVVRVVVPSETAVRWIRPITAPEGSSPGLVLLRGMPDAVEVSWYDEDLNAVDARWAEVPRGARLIDTVWDSGSLFALLVGPNGSQVTLLEIPGSPGELGSAVARIPRRLSPRGLAVGDRDWWLLSAGPRGPLIHRGTLDGSSELRAVLLPELPRRARAAPELVAFDNGFDLAVFGLGSRTGDMRLYHLDAGGVALVALDEGDQGREPWTEAYRLPGGAVVAGTWGYPGSERISAGLRWATLRDGRMQEPRDERFADIPGALVHLSERRRTRIEGGKQGRRDVASAVTRMHPLTETDQGVLGVVEHFQPRTRVESRTESFMVQGRMVQRVVTREVFLGWEPTHALAVSWNAEGRVHASAGVVLGDVLVPRVSPQLAISQLPGKGWLAWAHDQQLLFRRTPGSSNAEDEQAVSLLSEEVLAVRATQVQSWGEAVLVWGQQRSDKGTGKRQVTFLARVAWPSAEGAAP